MSKKSIKGVIYEYIAMTKLMKKGYYVSKAIDPQSPFDLVVISPTGKIELLDIKVLSYRKKDNSKISRVKTPNQREFFKKTGLDINLKMMNQKELII